MDVIPSSGVVHRESYFVPVPLGEAVEGGVDGCRTAYCSPSPPCAAHHQTGTQGTAPGEKVVWGHAAHGDVLSVTGRMVTHCSSLPGPCC